jgi:hypothetical protein
MVTKKDCEKCQAAIGMAMDSLKLLWSNSTAVSATSYAIVYREQGTCPTFLRLLQLSLFALGSF